MKPFSRSPLLALSVLALASCESTAPTDLPGASDLDSLAVQGAQAPAEDPIGIQLADAVSWDYNYPLTVSSSGKYLVDRSGRPFQLIGDAAWSLVVQLTKGDADLYLASRRSFGFDAVLVNLIEHKFGDSAPANVYGDAPFTGKTFTTPNEAYFAHADYVIQSAASKGILVLLAPLYLGAGSQGWSSEAESASQADMRAWGQWVANRYKGFDNIMWVIGGDADPTPVLSKVQAMVDGILSVDTRHPITAHNSRGLTAEKPWGGASWLNVDNIYPSKTGKDYVKALQSYDKAPDLPFFMVESWYDKEGPNAQELRYQTYGTGLSGSFGHVYGNCPVWHFNTAKAAYFCDVSGLTWKSQLTDQGAKNMKYARLLFESRNWHKLVPDKGHVAVTSGLGSEGGTNYVTAAYASDGSSIIAYLPSSRSITVDGSVLSSGSMKAWWYNPATGAATAVGTFSTSSPKSFTPSGAGDWVLVVDDAARGLAAPGNLGAGTPSNAPPTAGFSEFCSGMSCAFTDASSDSDGTISSRSWNFGDGGTSTTGNPTHTYASSGTFTVQLTVTDNDGASATFTKSVSAGNDAPSVGFREDCQELSCQFTDASSDSDGTISTRSWGFGDGSTSTAKHPTHAYPDEGTYTVDLTVTDNDGASATKSKSVTVAAPGGAANQAPTAHFSENCSDLSCTFTDASSDGDGTIASRSWTFGDGGTSTAKSPTHSFASAGTFNVKLTVTDDDGATGSFTRSVTVTAPPSDPDNDAPMVGFSESCSDLSCVFTDASRDADGRITNRAWTFGDGASSSSRNPAHTFAAGGTYTVNLTVTDDDGASATKSKSVTVAAPGGAANQAPTAHFSENCSDLSCTFTDASSDADGTIASRSWTFGDGGTSTAKSPTHSYASNGTFNVKLTVTDDDGATGSFTRSVTVTAPPSPVVSFSHSCSGLVCSFDNTSTYTVQQQWWSMADVGFAFGASSTYTFASAGSYDVTLWIVTVGSTEQLSHTETVTVGGAKP